MLRWTAPGDSCCPQRAGPSTQSAGSGGFYRRTRPAVNAVCRDPRARNAPHPGGRSRACVPHSDSVSPVQPPALPGDRATNRDHSQGRRRFLRIPGDRKPSILAKCPVPYRAPMVDGVRASAQPAANLSPRIHGRADLLGRKTLWSNRRRPIESGAGLHARVYLSFLRRTLVQEDVDCAA